MRQGCGLWQVVWLEPDAVRPVAVAGPAQRVLGWTELPTTPPVDPLGFWRPQWEAAVAVALAHLVAVSGGRRVSVPEGPVAETFRQAIDGLLPPGPPERHLVLAGPGLPAATADIALVPRHPQTGAAAQPFPPRRACLPQGAEAVGDGAAAVVTPHP